jgi:hypothetical protein
MASTKKQHIIGIVVVAIAIPEIAILWASPQMTAADAHPGLWFQTATGWICL